jgi:molybdopterin converting factor small subunit
MYRVLLFGDVKAAAGTPELRVRAPPEGGMYTVSGLLGALQKADGSVTTGAGAPFVPPHAWPELVRPSVLAIDLEYVATGEGLHQPVAVCSEIALIPPISGG